MDTRPSLVAQYLRARLLTGALSTALIAGMVQPFPASAQAAIAPAPRTALGASVMPRRAVIDTAAARVSDEPASRPATAQPDSSERLRSIRRPAALHARMRAQAPSRRIAQRDADALTLQGGSISYGQTVAGSILGPGQVVTYTFSGAVDDQVLLRAQEISGNIDPELRIYRPNGTQLCGWGTSVDFYELNCKLDATGVHVIQVGRNTGDFRLHLQRTNNPANATAITYGSTTSAAAPASPEMVVYTFNGTVGDHALLRIQETSGNIDPELRIYRPNGTQLCGWGTSVDFYELACELDMSGVHTIVAGRNTGSYRLYLQRTNAPANSTSIAYGSTTSAAAPASPEMVVYTFNGAVGDHALLRMQETSGNIDPELRIYRPNGSQLCGWGTSVDFYELACELDMSGVHTIVVGRNTGSYRLYLQRTNNPANGIAIAYGSTTSAAAPASPEMVAYTFNGAVGDHALLRMQETSGNIDPELRIYRPNGTQLCGWGTSVDFYELACELDMSGVHTILAGRNTGSYRLYLQRTNAPANSTSIAYGSTTLGSVPASPLMQAYTLDGAVGDHVLLRMQETSGNIDPELRIYRPNGTQLCGWGTSANLYELECTLDTSGVHAVLAGRNTGNYRLYLQRTNNPANAMPIVSGITQTNQIVSPPEMHAYVVNGAIGDQVTLRMQDASGNVNPEIRVYRPDGTQLCGWSTGGNLLNLDCTLDATGIHAILVGRNAGSYTLFVQGFSGVVTTSDLALDQPLTVQIGRNDIQFFKLALNQPGQRLLLEVTPLSGVNGLWLSGLFGALPLAGRHDAQSLAPTPRGTYEIVIAPTQAGMYYFSAFGRDIAAPGSYRIVARTIAGHVSDIQPRAGGNAGQVTLNLLGLGFVDGMQVQLRRGGSTLIADQVVRAAATSASARFNLAGAATGAYDVHVIFPDGSEAALPGAFTINPGIGPRLEAQLIVPSAVRRLTQSVLWVEYANTGDADMPAPLLVVSATNGVVMRLFTGEPLTDQAVQVLGVSFTGLAGTLPPGARHRIPIYFQSNAAGGTQLSFELSQMVADATPINWSAIQPAVRPNDIPAELWTVIWTNFTARMGATWADYQRALDDQASYLSRYGSLTYDVRDLFGALIGRASGAFLRRTLAGSLDAYAPARGLPLAFSRVAFDAFSQRYTVGPFGRGWSHNFEYSISRPDANTVVVRGPAGSGRTFIKGQNGAWQPSAGDYAKLEQLGDGSHRLREKDGQIWLFDATGRLSYLEEPNGNRVTLAYNGAGQLTAISHSNSQSFSLGYNAHGRISRLTDHAGRVTDYAYDASGEHLLSAAAPGGVTTQYAYISGGAANHALQTITFADGTHMNYEYDAQGRLAAQARDGNAERVAFTYDDLGSVFVTDATNATTTLRLGARGQPLEVQDPLGNRARFEYDCCARLVRVVQPDGATSTLTYDALGNPTQSKDPLNNVTTTAYTTDLSRLDWLRDAKNNVTDFTYDARGNLTHMTYPDGSFESYGYDGTGDLTGVTNRRNATITLTRNALGQITRKAYPDGRTIDYAYDALGNLTSAADSATGPITMQYDARGFLARIDYPGGRWFTFEYSNAGRRTRRTGHDGTVLNYAYDAAGRLQRLSDGANAEIIRYEYDAAGRLSRENKANGTYSLYSYDAAGQLLSLVNHGPNGSVQSRFDYTYDANGNRTAMTTLAGVTRYGYDALGQLTGVTYPDNRQVSYVYDALGNRVTVTDNGAVTTYATNALNQYTQVGNAAYGYDADGNMTSQVEPGGPTTYSYDAENRLTGVTAPGSTSTYTYDALGNRSAAVRNGAATGYLHDPIGLVDVAAEYDGGGALVARYVHGLGLVSRSGAGGAAYYAFDGTGHTRQMTDGGGAVVNNYDYDPFGSSLHSVEALPNPFEFVGRMGVVNENGWAEMRARQYNYQTGSFSSPDPVFQLVFGSYGYVHNNPLRFVDPLGTDDMSITDLYDVYDLTDKIGDAHELGERQLEGHKDLIDSYTDMDTLFSDPQAYVDNMKNSALRSTDRQWNILFGLFKGWLDERADRRNPKRKPKRDVKPNPTDEITPYRPPQPPSIPIPPYVEQKDNGSSQQTAATDPNEKLGPPGLGPTRAVRPTDDLAYTVFFENVMTATAPALQVVVVDQLDPDLDWTTFRPTGVGFGSNTYAIAQANDGFSLRTTIPDYRPAVNKTWWVDMGAQINYATGTVTWTLQTLDPLTGQPPDDPLAGFLPPNDATHRGEGYVTFSIRPLPNRPLNTVITNEASITFDSETTIVTNRVTNTLAWVMLQPLVMRDARPTLAR